MGTFRVKMRQNVNEIYHAEINADSPDEALRKAQSYDDWIQVEAYPFSPEDYEVLEEINLEKKVIDTIVSAIYNNPKLYREDGKDPRAILDSDDRAEIVAKVFSQKRFLEEIENWLGDVPPESIFDDEE